MPDCAPLAVQNEVKLLLELLPKYLAHVEKHPHTLLVKFFGLYRVLPENGSKVRSFCSLDRALRCGKLTRCSILLLELAGACKSIHAEEENSGSWLAVLMDESTAVAAPCCSEITGA